MFIGLLTTLRSRLCIYPISSMCLIAFTCTGISPGAEILASRTKELPIVTGNAMPLGLMPIGESACRYQ